MWVKFRPKFKKFMHEVNIVADIEKDQYFEYYSNLDKHFDELVETYKTQGKELTGGMFWFEGEDTKWLVGSAMGHKNYAHAKDWLKPTSMEKEPEKTEPKRNYLTIKDLYSVLSPIQNFQIGDAQTGEPLTAVDYLSDSGCEADAYDDYEISGIAPKIDKDGDPYLAIYVKLRP